MKDADLPDVLLRFFFQHIKDMHEALHRFPEAGPDCFYRLSKLPHLCIGNLRAVHFPSPLQQVVRLIDQQDRAVPGGCPGAPGSGSSPSRLLPGTGFSGLPGLCDVVHLCAGLSGPPDLCAILSGPTSSRFLRLPGIRIYWLAEKACEPGLRMKGIIVITYYDICKIRCVQGQRIGAYPVSLCTFRNDL